jgi:cytochrome b561
MAARRADDVLLAVHHPVPVANSKALASTIIGVHGWIGHSILILAAMHALAALFHHFVLHDDALLRMMPDRRARRAEAAAPPPPGAPLRQDRLGSSGLPDRSKA